MGIVCAPTYANIVMSEFEERYIYYHVKTKSSSYIHITDNIFMVQAKSENEIKSFRNQIKKNIIP